MTYEAAQAQPLPQRQLHGGLRRTKSNAARVRSDALPHAVLESATQRRTVNFPVLIFLVALVIPWIIYLGPLRMTSYRLILAIAVVLCVFVCMSGRYDRVRLPDIAVLLYAAWSAIAVMAVHGFAFSVQSSGMVFIESAGAYFLGRCFIRNADDFHTMVRYLFWVIVALLPFAFYESTTKYNFVRAMFEAVMETPPDIFMALRWGLRRAQTVFEHPILFGVVSSSGFALAYLVLGYGKSLPQRVFRAGLIAATAFLSLSSGPLTALAVQGMLIGWDTVLKSFPGRWLLLAGLFALMYVAISVGSNQSVAAFYVHYFAFSEATGWDRILIWHYGWKSVAAHPAFGIGFYEYVRPEWMEPSIDMFWLLNFVRYGIPGGVFMLVTFAAAVIPVMLKKGLSDRENAYRLAYLVTMAGFFVVGWAVHFWNATYVLFLFLLGSGMWLTSADPARAADPAQNRRPRTAADHKADGEFVHLLTRERRDSGLFGYGPPEDIR